MNGNAADAVGRGEWAEGIAFVYAPLYSYLEQVLV